MKGDSICWGCARSAAPLSVRCIWDATAGKKPVEGSEIDWVWIPPMHNNNGYTAGIVRKCPEFVSIYSVQGMELINEARINKSRREC